LPGARERTRHDIGTNVRPSEPCDSPEIGSRRILGELPKEREALPPTLGRLDVSASPRDDMAQPDLFEYREPIRIEGRERVEPALLAPRRSELRPEE
jgi:hypothetical protein